jgi:hypothetical protein
MKKSFLSLCGAVVMAVCCAFTMVGCFGNSSSDGSSGGNKNKQEFASGTGTEDDPYIINEDYQWLNITNYLDAYYELDADLNMGDYELLSPIGSDTDPFTGSINGNGHTVSGATIKAAHNAGLFGIVSGATIKNLGLTNSSVLLTSDSIDGDYMGSFIAKARKGTLVENCYSEKVNVKFSAGSGKFQYVGGFIGSIESVSEVKYCHCNVNISQSNDYSYPGFYIGGFARLVSGSSVDACYATGTITFGGPAAINAMRVGTFVDRVQNSTVTNMYTEMTINVGVNIDTYYFAGNVDTETLEYCLNFCSYQRTPKGRYEKCGLAINGSEYLNIYVSSADYATANDILDTSLWQDNKVWKKGKIHPELVSYEEYVALQAQS